MLEEIAFCTILTSDIYNQHLENLPLAKPIGYMLKPWGLKQQILFFILLVKYNTVAYYFRFQMSKMNTFFNTLSISASQLIVRIALCASYVLYSVGSQINWYCVLDFISCQGFQPGLLDINQKHIFSNVLIYIYLMFKVICDHLSVFQHMESVIIDFSSML